MTGFIRSSRSAGSRLASTSVIRSPGPKMRTRYAQAAGQRSVPAAANKGSAEIRIPLAKPIQSLVFMTFPRYGRACSPGPRARALLQHLERMLHVAPEVKSEAMFEG